MKKIISNKNSSDVKKESDDLLKRAIQLSPEKHPPLRNETDSERIMRYAFLYEDGDKPEHYDDPLINKIDTFSDYGKLREKASELQDQTNLKTGKPVSKEFIQEAYPKKYDHFNKNSYPSTGRPQGQISTWDLIKKTAKTHQEKKEIRGILHREYKKDKTRLEPDELRMIYKHPDQLKAMSEIKAQPVKTTQIFKLDEPFQTITNPIPPVSDYIRTQQVFKPGLSEDFLALRTEIKKNYDYVMGKDDDLESKKVSQDTTTDEETN